ncbi:MAG TPA: Maf family protein, partial [Puia sp.]|nr:Maf family protein [Puia sp.]
MKIILASQSPRRKQLLEWAEIDFEVIVKPTAEDYPI